MEETISLQDLFKTLKKRLVLILVAVVLAVTAAGVISFLFLTPIYQASTQILVNQQKVEQSQFNAQDIQTNLQLINTYNVIIKSPAILSKVIKNLDLDTTPAALSGKLTVNSEQDSQVVSISVQDPEAFRAVDIANTTAIVFQEEIQKLMNVDNVNILSKAIPAENPAPIKPDPYLNMAIAAVIGLMLGVGIAFLLEYLDTTVKTEDDIEELLGLPILGLISPIPEVKAPSAIDALKQRRKER
ncbi:Wzz/FepE/Etk N-terminal domain-containing protein [Filibacter tadaridae]|uniref:Capsular polysaccharide type 8 biosynthesis protein cap8A n=1 Tax=Filibacter tadaridae TaxID=2483811 RepID=A0A3P5XPP1_9BACL|nr:Wzz/FepE/Etk N-terminal domain-containing protein [Filibacter tadaridae]VDC33679.1 Capsular polysaccharide type 8 biosynthesis protein cap8A [Filibacter tadaridae]